jgi:hypothetical protein
MICLPLMSWIPRLLPCWGSCARTVLASTGVSTPGIMWKQYRGRVDEPLLPDMTSCRRSDLKGWSSDRKIA